jgi:hypothetical protein
MNLFMQTLKRKQWALLSLVLLAGAAHPKSPQRLDMYDYAGNPLMFVTFEYDGQKNVSRTVYMSDSTFVRKVAITYDLQGKRARECSINFNGDTVFNSDYQYRGDTTGFSIKDIFGLDQMGGRVRYRTNNPSQYSFSYQVPQDPSSSVTYNLFYEFNGAGDPKKVTVTNHVPEESYYGIFIYDGVGTIAKSMTQPLSAQVRVRNARTIDVRINLEKFSLVKCALVTLSGRCAGLLYEGRMGPGAHSKTLRVGQSGLSRLAEGVYVVAVSVDGATVMQSKFLFQHSSFGGVQ